MTITIRPPSTIKECEAIEWLQSKIWGELGVVPGHFLLTIAKEGGVVLLALDDQKPVGFSYAFLGLTEKNRLKLASHQAGVLPAYQDSGLGYQIKLAQREASLEKNINYITWTFDPLQGRNARFNLRKLGAVSNTYFPNLYGEMPDSLNKGLPSDRFRVDWWLTTEHVMQRISGHFTEATLPPCCPILNPAVPSDKGVFVPADKFELPSTEVCLVEIPADLSALKTKAPQEARRWSLQTRQIFETAFKQGYTAIDLLRQAGHNYYLLQKNWQQV